MLDYIKRYIKKDGYLIPFYKMSAEVSEDVITMLSYESTADAKWALFRDKTGNYVLKLVNSKQYFFNLSTFEMTVLSVCRKYQLQPYMIMSVSTAKYFSNSLLQKLLDLLLQKGAVDSGNCCLGLIITGKKTFNLVEVRRG